MLDYLVDLYLLQLQLKLLVYLVKLLISINKMPVEDYLEELQRLLPAVDNNNNLSLGKVHNNNNP